jgi:putative transcriptional regulator
MELGKVTIMRVPSIQNGGSGRVDLERLKKEAKNRHIITSIGLESFVALGKAQATFYQYGATEAAIEAAKSGLNPLVVCVENEAADLVTHLEKERISYELLDAMKA